MFSGELFKPPSEREGDRIAVEGAYGSLKSDRFYYNALSLSRLRRQLPPGGSLSLLRYRKLSPHPVGATNGRPYIENGEKDVYILIYS